jgi:hypothetical protein
VKLTPEEQAWAERLPRSVAAARALALHVTTPEGHEAARALAQALTEELYAYFSEDHAARLRNVGALLGTIAKGADEP